MNGIWEWERLGAKEMHGSIGANCQQRYQSIEEDEAIFELLLIKRCLINNYWQLIERVHSSVGVG